MINDKVIYTQISTFLNNIGLKYNYHVAPSMTNGRPGKNIKSVREYRMQLIDKKNDTSSEFRSCLRLALESSEYVSNIQFNEVSPNSSKYSSFTFDFMGKTIDVIIARGANKGETFEAHVIEGLQKHVAGYHDKNYDDLIKLMISANPKFSANIVDVKPRIGSTKKEGIPIEELGSVIGDIVLLDSNGQEWFISLKDINGDTFSSYSGASSLFDKSGTLQPNSDGATFLNTFGVDLNKVQSGFDERQDIVTDRTIHQALEPNQDSLRKIFQRAWGMNYFYVRRMVNGWKVFWIDQAKLDELSDIKVKSITYPSQASKQIVIYAESSNQRYKIEIRNSKGGEYTNDIKFKVI